MRNFWRLISLLFVLGELSCNSFDCHTENESREALRSVPVPLDRAGGGALAAEGSLNGDEAVRRQSYTIDPDGEFTFNRSVETGVGHLGVELSPLDEKKAKRLHLEPFSGVFVRSVENKGPADKAGLQPEDVIVTYNGKEVSSPQRLELLIEETKPGERVEIGLERPRFEPAAVAVKQRGAEHLQVAVEVGMEKRIVSGKGIQQQLPVLDDRGRTGLKLVELTDQARPIVLGPAVAEKGLLVIDLLPGGPAFQGDLRVKDYLIKVGDQPVPALGDYSKVVAAIGAGHRTVFTVLRGQQSVEAPVDLSEDATAGSRFNLLNLVKYRSRPEHFEFSLIFGILFNCERCSAVRERDHAARNVVSRNWGTLLDLIEYHGTRGGEKELRIAWLLPISWGSRE
ncbi:MAG: PDZ domain-containing protein [Planctomycetes bacterium]|nr:PDZ domain-containing protein [Planctomycetota bacterium]